MLKKEFYSSKCDVWSSGCLLYKMLYGDYVFTAKDLMTLLVNIESKVKGKDLQFPQNVVVSDSIKNFLRSMLQYNEFDRLSWEQMFVHPVFTDFNQNKKDNITVHINNYKPPSPLYVPSSLILPAY